jgi:hypothetical protein
MSMNSAYLAVTLALIAVGFGCGIPVGEETMYADPDPISSVTETSPPAASGGAAVPATSGTGGSISPTKAQDTKPASTGGASPVTSGGAGGEIPPAGRAGSGGSAPPSSASGAGGTVSGNCTASETIRLIGNKVFDASGAQFAARGPELVVADVRQVKSIDAIAATGANSMRMLLTLDAVNGMTPEGFDTLIGRAVSHSMIVWVSLYSWDDDRNNAIGSSLGGGNFYSLAAPKGSTACSRETPTSCYLAVWSRAWLKDLMAKYKANVIIDAMQEFINGSGNSETEEGRALWADHAKTNIKFFRGEGYNQPLEIMSNFEGRDLYAIVEKGAEIRAADTLKVGADPQTMFGWQAYWATDWYKSWQGELLTGAPLTGAQAINRIVKAQTFPIQVGIDNYGGDTAGEYREEIDQAVSDGVNWLWWSWDHISDEVECPVNGASCQAYVMGSANGFAGAKRSSCGL